MSGEEKNNKSFYKETFEEIPVPEGLAEKVGRIVEREEKSKRIAVGSVMRKVAIAAAILVALFAGSNGIAYAMTGETWVEKIILRRNIYGVDPHFGNLHLKLCRHSRIPEKPAPFHPLSQCRLRRCCQCG